MNKNRFLIPLMIGLVAATGADAQVGIGTTTPNSMLDVRGSLSTNYRIFTTSVSALATDHTLVFEGTSARTLTLPTAVGCTGRSYWIKNASLTLPTPVLTIATTSGQTLDGSASWTLDEPDEAIKVISDGANWYVLTQNVIVPKTATTGGSWLQGGNKLAGEKSLGTITNIALPFITNNVERMRLSTTGFLGIGTTAPAGRLHLLSEASDTGNDYIFDDYGVGTTQGLYMRKSRGTAAAPTNLAANDAIGFLRFVPRFNGSLGTTAGSAIEGFYRGNGTNDLTDLRAFTSGVERMRISETGNVGIGSSAFNATNPEKLLVDAGVTTSYNVISGKGNTNNYLQLNIQNRSAEGSASSDVVASSNNATETTNFIDFGINSSGYDNTSLPILAGANTAYMYATGRNFILGNGTAARDMIFFTNGFNDTDEKMRIMSTGNVGIGVTNPADKLTVAGVIAPSADNLYTLGKTTARWSQVWAADGVIQTSDARLKTNILPLSYGLSEVLRMEPVRYDWISNPGSMGKIGLIAQDVQKIIPEVVTGDATKENLGMNYAELVPVLINAVKEQQQQIDAIQERVNALKKTKTAATCVKH
ncbi:MAG: tail fiber domain-containing protein [Gemmatimonadaceae bacterium]|nr:tail fiber domain-containing protein [Chitinophagaceae bacterium]